jgi:hypothetical protein
MARNANQKKLEAENAEMAKPLHKRGTAEDRKTSRHRHSNNRIVRVDRRWDDAHLEAGYHLQEWGEHSKRGHDLHGDYQGTTGPLRVDHLDDHEIIGGPVFRITLPDGALVDVLCADTVRAYLDLHGVVE